MNRQAEIAPSFVLSTQFPCPPSGSMSRPRGRPPLPPKNRPTTSKQTELQNFNPGPMVSQPVFSFGSLPPMSSTPAPLSPSAGLDAMQMIYPKPTEMPVGVNNSKEVPGGEINEFHGEPSSFMDGYIDAYMELDKLFDFSIENYDVEMGISTGDSENIRRGATNSSVKKRAYTRRARKSVVDGNSSPKLPPPSQVGIEKPMFTESQMEKIERSEKLRKVVVTDPKYVKRVLGNREAGARTQERQKKHILEMGNTIRTLAREVATVTAHISDAEKTKLGLEEENKQMRLRLQEMEEQADFAKGLTEYYYGEINRLKQKERGEAILNMDENMLDQLSLKQLLDEEALPFDFSLE